MWKIFESEKNETNENVNRKEWNMALTEKIRK